MTTYVSPNALSLTFLGTSAGSGPYRTRNCSSTALNLPKESWLIDCAEGTQQMMLRIGKPLPENITRVFITRMRVDNVFGLVPLIITRMYVGTRRSAHVQQDEVRLCIYGPAGLREFVRSNLKATNTKLSGKYVVHELLRAGEQQTSCSNEVRHENEAVGLDIFAGNDGTWSGFEAHDGWTITAGPVATRDSGSPSMGYVFQEPSRPLPLSNEYMGLLHSVPLNLLPPGMRTHGDLLRRLRLGTPVSVANGRYILEPLPDTPGRKIVILGPTCDASPCAENARNADILVHEATEAPMRRTYRKGVAFYVTSREANTTKHAIKWGHSTPRMAGTFAKRINARILVMNYFCERLQGLPDDDDPDLVRDRNVTQRRTARMTEVERQAALAMDPDAIAIAAEDGLILDIPFRTTKEIQTVHGTHGIYKDDYVLKQLSANFEGLEVGSDSGDDRF
ncbi:hypothetical protein EXIGLDRAFT_725372 [Exidia glandulosa HHB12029]|uniref:Metallo-beta-lactamase domain-containing protein n=1 Tax=Exidia glandulosa HHB12029 TaxID=1314781 RepID=A0A165MKV8_EXIGL|nr:hypothetical protein EXIGLDRAFT_725372 [Exidia glandulosa HHB12029]